MTYSPDGHWLASGSADDTVRVWDTENLDAAPRVLETLGAERALVLLPAKVLEGSDQECAELASLGIGGLAFALASCGGDGGGTDPDPVDDH